MSAKTRYYLEQSVPELEDLIRKGLFDKQEINHIMKKRTDFEHRICSRGSKPRDYLKYVEFEKNLEKLRKKRYNRLNSVGLINTNPSISDWSQERRILFIFDRSVGKFPADLKLWEGYLDFAKSEKLFKKIYKIYTQLLQLHPTSVESWIDAASFEFDYIGSAKNARILFQRGLRFNKDSKKLWLSYIKFELNYIVKLINRRKILGLITEKQQLEHEKSEQVAQNGEEGNELDNDLITLPTHSNDELKTELNLLPDADVSMLGNPETNPALKGDVALLIFDIYIETLFKLKTNTFVSEFQFKYDLSQEILQIFKHYESLNREYLSNHVIQYLLRLFPTELSVIVLDISSPLSFKTIGGDEFVDVLQSSTKKYLAYKSKLQGDDKLALKKLFSEFLANNFLHIEEDEDNDGSIEKTKQILASIIKKL